MAIVLIIGIPVFIILSIIIQLKLRGLFSYLIILAMGGLAPFIVDFIYCSVLDNECKPDALSALGIIFHSFYIIIICSVIYVNMPNRFKRLVPLSSDKSFK